MLETIAIKNDMKPYPLGLKDNKKSVKIKKFV
jgi:hypothetical protein